MIEWAQILLDALSLGSYYATCALGIGFIFGVLKLVNLAHGELMMVAGYTLFALRERSPVVMVGGALVAVVLAAVLMERIAFRGMRKGTPVTLMVSSLTLSVLLQNVPLLLLGDRAGARAFSVPEWVNEQVEWQGLRIPKLQLVMLVTTFCLVALLVAFLRMTKAGLRLRAVSEDLRLARLLGIRVHAVTVAAFALSGVLAMVAACLCIAQSGLVKPTLGQQPLLVGLVATVVGGMESLWGTLMGGFLIGTITVLLEYYLPTSLTVFRDAFVFGFVLLMLLVLPRGIIPARMAHERL